MKTRHGQFECTTRRDFLRLGTLSALGLPFAGGLRAADQRQTTGRARRCILIWLDGGPSHLDLFDLKPEAPAEVRGPFRPIETRVPGMQISELLPRSAKIADRFAIIRSMTSPLGEHNLGTHYLLTGYHPSPALVYPCLGSVTSHELGGKSLLPEFIAVPNHRVGGAKTLPNGFLPSTTMPFEVGQPVGNKFQVPHLDYFPGLSSQRLDRRREFVQALDQFSRSVDGVEKLSENPVLEQAHRLITSPKAKRAFKVEEEPDAVRQRYGSKPIGQCCLLARRLIERDVRFVTVNNTGWDTHQQLVTTLKDGFTGAQTPVGLIPSLDLALSALLEELDERGLLSETLVLVMGEFGRTPKINTGGGRDHWPRAFSVLLAGAGIPGGQVIGSSDSTGESVAERPITPADLARTIYTLLGVDVERSLYTPDGRPVKINQEGKVISELVS